jgi:hypothetical protein
MIIKKKPSNNSILKSIFFLLISGLLFPPAVSQKQHPINLKEIPQKKVRRYIEKRSINKMDDFSAIHSSWNNNTDESAFNINEKIFNLKYKLSKVWGCYTHADPLTNWSGRKIRFGLLISKPSNSVTYRSNPSPTEIDTGQVYFLNLRIIKGLVNVPVAFEITRIDYSTQLIEFSYLDNNKSQGRQTIQFFNNPDGNTMIVHRSYFKSDSRFRDQILYPYFHKRFINEFHRNMKKLVREPEFEVAFKD